ncbi:AMP-binding protein [Streptacidiphilus sp. ASG 303]|uniref:AMP-binding protein n=1 Tax=Streptacidiphilus sp. ASG 303 TaxID=2896847 RepID=UPI001E2A4EC7|nr:AMP-binding protein [Streptacidiphilus sp. ASG 303]MCD0485155.1 AMP-binding protein [Streptacidiphilus sp. ASG 303]
MADRLPAAAGLPELPARLDGLLAEAAAAHPDRTALAGVGRPLDYAALDRRVSEVAAALDRLPEGAPPGGTVAVASVLHPDFAVAYYAVARAGRVVAVVNPLLREEELVHVLGLCEARVLFADAALDRRLAAVRERLPALRRVVLMAGTSEDAPGDAPGDRLTLDGLAGQRPDPVRNGAAPGDVACVQFTSGTTGRPKGVRLTHRNLVVNAAQIAQAHRLDGGSVTVNHLPTFHPMHLNSAVRAGATQVLCAAPEPSAAVAAADEHGATHLYSLPVRLARLAAGPAPDGPSLRTVARIASGGSALPPAAARRLTERFGVPVFQGYGLAETSPLTHSDDPDHPVHGSVGRPVAGTECRVVDVDTRAVLPPGAVGEVQLRGPQVMKGYLGGPDGTGLEPDGWLTTGDVGRVDEEGRLFLVDRLKDVFKCDNFLVAPSEVEQALLRHPLVREAVVVDLPDGFGGAVAGALVVLRPPAGAPAGASAGGAAEVPAGALPEVLAEVLAEVNEGLPYYQQVRYAEAVDGIPRSGNGKIQRRVLRDALAARTADGRPPLPLTERSAMSAPLFTVVNTFTLKRGEDAEEFERRFLEHVRWMRAQEGFHSHQAVRRADAPGVYVNLGWWTSAEDFQKVLASEVFQRHAAEFHEIVDVDADPSMGAVRVDGGTVPTEGRPFVLVEYFTVTGDAAEFERAFRAYAQAAARGAGFGHTDLARSLFKRPGGWTAATWWGSEEACREARSGPEYAAVLAQAEVEPVVAAPVAGNRADRAVAV